MTDHRRSSSPSVEDRVADALGTAVRTSAELDGGEVGAVHRVTLADGRTVAAKTSDTPLDVEAFMLSFLADRGLAVPDLYYRSDDLLVMEHVEGDAELSPRAEREVARHLAALHDETPGEAGNSDRAYGFPRDTLTGPYRQPNPWTESWLEFFRDRRLRHFTEMGRRAGLVSPELRDRLNGLARSLDSLLPESPPASLLHGDVWANNVVVRNGTVRAFLDPACYFGHAEVELAYADFVGFGDAFFGTYDDERGIDAGFFEGRRDAYLLVPLLEHLLYFEDDRYAEQIRTVLDDLGY